MLDQLATVSVREGENKRAWELAEYSQKVMEIFKWSYSGLTAAFDVALEERGRKTVCGNSGRNAESPGESLDYERFHPFCPSEDKECRSRWIRYRKTDDQSSSGLYRKRGKM